MAEKQRILIVDDDYNIAELISLYLTKECFETKIVGDGEEALRVFPEFQPNLILLDLMLPGIDGYQVCRELRSTSQVPIIMLSAKGEIFDKVLGLELGADDYMIKPFDSKELVARVKAVLRRYQPPVQTPASSVTEQHGNFVEYPDLIVDYAMNNETFAKIVGTKSTTIYINNQSRQINNTNELLGVLNGVVGVKTGFTNNAGRCLVTETKRNNIDIITIVLGADTKKDRTKDSVNLIEYTFSKYKMYNLEEQIIKEFNKWKNINEKRILIINGKTSNPKLALGAIEKATIPICDNDKIEYSINALTEVEAPVEQWNVMGTLTVKLNGEILENIDIVNVNEVQKRDWKDYFKIVLNRFENMGKMLINQQI